MASRTLFKRATLPRHFKNLSILPHQPLSTAISAGRLKNIPEAEDTPFEVPLPDGCFQTYELDPPPNTLEVTKKELKRLYYDMQRIRRLEMSADRLYKERKVRGFCHLSVGQEAVAVGIENAITREDKFITAYRCHGNVLMRGGTPQQIIGEILGRRGGICYGKGGSVHMYYKNFFGGNGIVGASVPVGTGLAFAQQYNETGNVTINLYGDGAANQGQVFEAFNMAKLWKLPVIFGCENNKFAMGTSAERSSAMTDYYKRGQYIPGLKIDGMDVLAVTAATKFGKEYCVSGKGPLVFEYATYRFYGHSVSDPGTTYRTRADVRAVRDAEDPVINYYLRLMDWGISTKEELKEIEKEARAEVDRGVEEAEKMPPPDAVPSVLFEDSYVRGSEPRFIRGRTLDETYYFD